MQRWVKREEVRLGDMIIGYKVAEEDRDYREVLTELTGQGPCRIPVIDERSIFRIKTRFRHILVERDEPETAKDVWARLASKPFSFSQPQPRSFNQMVGRQKRLPDEMVMIDGLSKKEILERYTLNMQEQGGYVLTPAQKECAQMMWATRLKQKVVLTKREEEAKATQVVVEWDSYDE